MASIKRSHESRSFVFLYAITLLTDTRPRFRFTRTGLHGHVSVLVKNNVHTFELDGAKYEVHDFQNKSGKKWHTFWFTNNWH